MALTVRTNGPALKSKKTSVSYNTVTLAVSALSCRTH
jgi:hypothetical protein